MLTYHTPERKDCENDAYGSVLIYVKDHLNYIRRQDLEPRGVECLWVNIILIHKRFLFSTFYRTLNVDLMYLSLIENSMHLAIDTGIKDIVITGGFNYNMLFEPS